MAVPKDTDLLAAIGYGCEVIFKPTLVTLLVAVFLASGPASAQSTLSRYRDVTLGDTVQVVADRLEVARQDVTILHARPALVEELTWRPNRYVSGPAASADTVAEVVMTFHADRVARMVVVYERERTQGLTDADLVEALTEVYGRASLASTPTQPARDPSSERRTFGRWEDADTVVLLWREVYPNRVGLTITSITADRALQQAIADGERLYLSEAPQRDVDRRAAEAAAVAARDEKLRLENKKKFKP
jgi:hypothetical protein